MMYIRYLLRNVSSTVNFVDLLKKYIEDQGNATLEGKNLDIEKLLEVNPQKKIPPILDRVYQHVFTSTYLLANLLDTSYPPADMLYSGEMSKQGPNGHVEWGKLEEAKQEEPAKETKKKGKKR
jgi:hypothetical protein